MKTIHLLFIGALFFMFLSCQSEEEEIVNEPPPSGLLVPNTPLVNLIRRATQNPTSVDNVIDNSSCFTVQLPVTVIVNGNTILVSNPANYQTVQQAIDAFSDDDDLVNFVYPISIQFQDFSTLFIADRDALDNALDGCDDDDDFAEIDCIAFNYPINVNLYDTNNQIANTVTMSSNLQFFNFLNGLSPQVLATIVYPISVTDAFGLALIVGSNSALQDFVENSIGDCDDSIAPNPNFTSVLTSGTWIVSYYFEDDDDETDDYIGYNFTFNSNFTISVMKDAQNSTGAWANYLDNGSNELDLNFSDSNLQELNEDWKIVEYSSNQIRLRHISGGDDMNESYLYFTKI